MRIVAGAAKGRPLGVPSRGTRPTSDRTREAMFSTLESLRGSFSGARVLDLYAGSGALGLEALSRGASHVLLVESSVTAARIIRHNSEAVGLSGAVVRQVPVERLVAEPPDAPYDVIFADPPYDVGNAGVEGLLGRLVAHGWLGPEAVVVVERSRRTPPFTWPPEIDPVDERTYGEAALWYGRAP